MMPSSISSGTGNGQHNRVLLRFCDTIQGLVGVDADAQIDADVGGAGTLANRAVCASPRAR